MMLARVGRDYIGSWNLFFCRQVFDHLNEIQKEVSLSVQDVTKMQKTYKDEEHVTHDARLKAAEADDK